MRCFAAVQTCVALVLALFAAPFQHVHEGSGPDHDHATVVHSHLYRISSLPAHDSTSSELEPADDHARVRSLDTFTIELTNYLPLFLPSQGLFVSFTPTIFLAPFAVAEERGHDPPTLDRSIPRAPPA